jgi:hypothetical protein
MIVDSTGDEGDSNTADGICDDGMGTCTLRAAIQQANATAGADTIIFDIPGGGPYIIQPATALPAITDPVVIDGTTQPGYAGTPLVRLDGISAGSGASGLTLWTGASTIHGLMITRFAQDGIAIAGSGGGIFSNNFIGTDGTTSLGNGRMGILVSQSPNNIIGGLAEGDGNLISGNGSNGIHITGAAGSGNIIWGNKIGTDITGTLPLGNAGAGVYLSNAPVNTIGGNLISGNINGIVFYEAGTTGNRAQGNKIGTDITGTLPLGNSSDGIGINKATNNIVGGARPGDGNLIADSGDDNIDISSASATGNAIQGNKIGTDISGTLALGSATVGISISGAVGNVIGGTQPGAGNLVSGGNVVGILIYNGGSGNVVQGNKIGTDISGTLALGNGQHGIRIDGASNNLIGGTGLDAGNLIAYNAWDGVDVRGGGTGNAIRGNRIENNLSMGIDLYPNDMAINDEGDADSGPNNLQNYPVLSAAASDTQTTTVDGTLNSTASTTFQVDFYASPTCDASTHGEGQTYLGSGQTATDGSGNASFSLEVSTGTPEDWVVTATATDPNGNTSEFSTCVEAVVTAPTTGEYNWHYQYDDLSRVTYACSDWTGTACEDDEWEFEYDGAGNITKMVHPDSGTTLYTYNSANEIVTACTDANTNDTCDTGETQITYQYDDYGNLTNDGQYEYIYDVTNHLVEMKVNEQTVATSTYNGDGDLVSITVLSVTTSYVRDWASPQKVVLTETSGANVTRNLYGMGLIAQQLPDSSVQYALYDGMRSIRQFADDSGDVSYTQTFDPYGGLYDSTGSSQSAYGFMGLQGLEQSPLLYFDGKWYHTGSGRLLQPQKGLPNPYVPLMGLSLLGFGLLVSPWLRKKQWGIFLLVALLVSGGGLSMVACTGGGGESGGGTTPPTTPGGQTGSQPGTPPSTVPEGQSGGGMPPSSTGGSTPQPGSGEPPNPSPTGTCTTTPVVTPTPIVTPTNKTLALRKIAEICGSPEVGCLSESSSDEDIISHVLLVEAASMGYQGMADVGQVIQNRVADPGSDFPKDPVSVVIVSTGNPQTFVDYPFNGVAKPYPLDLSIQYNQTIKSWADDIAKRILAGENPIRDSQPAIQDKSVVFYCAVGQATFGTSQYVAYDFVLGTYQIFRTKAMGKCN